MQVINSSFPTPAVSAQVIQHLSSSNNINKSMEGENGTKNVLFPPSAFSMPNNYSEALPLYLPRPEYMEVPRKSMEAIDPALGLLSISKFRDLLTRKAHADDGRTFQIIQKYKVKESNFPKEMRIIIDAALHPGPSHMLAVHGPPGPIGKHFTKLPVQMYPVHALYVAAHCAKLAPFPPQINLPERVSEGREFTLPVVFVFSSSPTTFPLLLEYLYRKKANILFARLIRLSQPPATIPGLDKQELLALSLGTLGSRPQVTQILHTLNGFWENTCSLGVYDNDLWTAIDSARNVVLMAMALRHGRLDTMKAIKAAAESLDCELDSDTESDSDDSSDDRPVVILYH